MTNYKKNTDKKFSNNNKKIDNNKFKKNFKSKSPSINNKSEKFTKSDNNKKSFDAKFKQNDTNYKPKFQKDFTKKFNSKNTDYKKPYKLNNHSHDSKNNETNFEEKPQPNFIFGRKVILESINTGVTINKIYFSKGSKGAVIDTIFKKAREKNIIFSFLEKRDMDRKFGDNTQGVIAFTTSKKYLEFDDLIKNIENDKTKSFKLCILDGITDPHNTGAIIRSAYAFGFDAILIPQRNSCLINNTVIKSSAGAATNMQTVQIGNIKTVINELKNHDFIIIGADKNGDDIEKFKQKKLTTNNLCLILGSEGDGIKKIVKENCTTLVKINISESFDSLNVSCAAAILFYELTQTSIQNI